MNLMDKAELAATTLACLVIVIFVTQTVILRRRLNRAIDRQLAINETRAEDAALADWARRTTLTITRADAMIETYTVEQLHEVFPAQRTWTSPVAVTVWTRSPHTLSIFAENKRG